MADHRPSSTLVNVAEHAELRLVQLLAASAPPGSGLDPSFLAGCERHIAAADAVGLLDTVLKDSGAVAALFGMDPPDEAVSAFSLLASLLDRATDPSAAARVASDMADVAMGRRGGRGGAGSIPSYDAAKGAAMLCALYNLRADPKEKCALLRRIVSHASATDPSLLEPGRPLGDALDCENVTKTLDGWGSSRAERRDLYRAAADGIGGSGAEDAAERRQRFLLLLVGTCEGAAEVDVEAGRAARDAAIGAVRDPVALFDEQRGMLGLSAVAALAANPATKPLHELLRIFQEGKLEDFDAFTSSHPSALSDLGLVRDECVRNMRLLSLCSLAAEHEEIPYSAIATTLRVDDSEVESWVIAAVSSGLLSAKMDQLQRVVLVERCVIRRFGPEQWKSMKGTLDAWKESVNGILRGLEAGQAAIQQASGQ